MGAGTIVKSGFFKASVYNPATGDVVQFNKIATEFTEFTKEPITTDTSTGQIFGGFDSRLVIGFVEVDGLEQLEQWEIEATELNAVVAGVTNVLWYEDVTITVERSVGVNARDGVSIHQVVLEHVSYQPAIQASTNLLNAAVKTQGFLRGWADSDSDNIADGYSLFQATADSFTNDEQTISGSGFAQVFLPFAFPISGLSVLLSSLIVKDHTEGSDVGVEQQDYSGTILVNNAVAVTSNVNRTEVSATLQANIYNISCRIVLASNATGSDTQIVSNPALRLDNSGKYIAG